MKILLVEDERSLGEILIVSLTSNHYVVDLATNGEMGLEFASLWKYDLVILDVNLPKLDGLSVCRKLRSQGFVTPILMLTGQGSDREITTGLDAGADDYLVKPCNIEQLLARIRALLRRGNIATISPVLNWGDLSLDPAIAEVTYCQNIVAIRPKEYALLELFLRCPQQIFSREAIIDRLWIADDCPTKHAVTNLIKDLRQRLNAADMTEELIDTVYGIGYRLKVPPQTLSATHHPLKEVLKVPIETKVPLKKPLTKNKVSESRFSEGIAKIKERFDASLEERMKVLLEAGRLLQQGQLTSDQRISAKDDVHRLAGTLGTFGYPEASEIANELESLLIGANLLTESEIIRINLLILKLEKALTKSSDPVTVRVLSEPLKPILLFLGDDLKFADALYLEAIANGFQFKMLEPVNLKRDLEKWIAKDTISVILMTLNPKSKDLESDYLSQLSISKQYFPTIPVLILADCTNHDPQDILRERVEVARRGCDRYLLQPTTPNEIFTVVNQLIIQMRSQSLPISETKKAKIMVVDDDPIILEFLTNLLQPWGLQVTCLDNPLEFWQVLTATQPNLLILDLEMPTFKGLELCQVIRSDPQWISLPILMITARQEAEIIAQAFAAGCDDFVRKPIIEPEIIARILKHLEPAQIRQEYLSQ